MGSKWPDLYDDRINIDGHANNLGLNCFACPHPQQPSPER
jgi:hypothetical protein